MFLTSILYCFFFELDNDWIKSGFNHMNRHGVCGTETVTIKTVFFLLWQGLTSALMFHFLISTNIVNKNGNFRN